MKEKMVENNKKDYHFFEKYGSIHMKFNISRHEKEYTHNFCA